MAITQDISNFPPAPDSQTDTPTEFNSKADAFVNHQSAVYVDEVNTWADQANQVQVDINNIVATLPDGTINDTVTALDSTYSSTKIENLLSENSGLPSEVGNANQTVSNAGVAGDSFWSPFVHSPQAVTEDFTLSSTGNASIVSPTINDGVTVTIPDGAILVIL